VQTFIDWSLEPSEADRQGISILLQYHLHKLFVLFIYHPARGHNLAMPNIASVERHEWLMSARAVLRLQNSDTGIWSNWDLVVSSRRSNMFGLAGFCWVFG
jgi:hypothetical protein